MHPKGIFFLLALAVGSAVTVAASPASVSLVDGTSNLSAGEVTTVRQSVRLSESVLPGGAIMIARHWLYPGALQNVDPRLGNFVSVRAGASLQPGRVVRGGLHGGLLGEAVLPVFEVTEGELAPGDEILVTYERLRMPQTAVNQFYLPLYIKTGPEADWQYVETPTFSVDAGSVSRLEISAPAETEPGVPVSVLLRMTDEFGNLAIGNFPSLEVLIDGQFSERVEAGTDPTPLISLTFDSPGEHEIDIRSSGGGIRASKRIDAALKDGYETRWVELHAHTNLSDGLLSPSEVRQRFIGVVDDLVIADHDAWMTAEAWGMRERTLFDGFVWTSDLVNGGHHLVLTRESMAIQGTPRSAFPDPYQLIEGVRRLGGLVVALPEVPTDLRFVDPASLRLVEIKSGEGTFEWFGNRVAARGLRVGFTGSATSHIRQGGAPSSTGRTAAMVAPGETLFDALHQGRTWVTSGPRIDMSVTVNDELPGGRAPANELRLVRGHIRGTSPIQRVELVRNGEVVDVREYAHRDDAQTIKVTFHSETAPLNGQVDVPRNGREWIGYLKATGTAILGLQTPGFAGDREAAIINPQDASRVDFITWTRGQPSSFLLDLDFDTEDAVIEMALKSGFEDLDQLGIGRKPAEIPAATFVLSLQELIGGTASRQYDVDGYHDRVTFELVDTAVPSAVEFQFNDRREHSSGDYYYVRVTQLDDHQAWSSPVFVGGFDFAQ